MLDTVLLAPSGSVGTLVGTGVALHNGNWDILGFQFVVENAGVSPTVTYKFQGSLDNSNWFDIGYITDASDTISQAPLSMTAAGANVCFISNPIARRFLWYRVVVSANNNITFRAEVYRLL